MFETFKRHFLLDSASNSADLGGRVGLTANVAELLSAFGGCSFNGGLYRVVRVSDLDAWASRIGYAFPEFKEQITCFGYDWLGRAFAVDSKRFEAGKPGVVMFEPGSGHALEIPANIETFHDNELINCADSALDVDFYDSWRKFNHSELAYDQCVSYKKPLFLGGSDDIENLEICDIDVYWHIFGQLILKVKGLSVGTPVRVSIS